MSHYIRLATNRETGQRYGMDSETRRWEAITDEAHALAADGLRDARVSPDAAKMVSDDTGTFGAIMTGAGKTMHDLGAGIQDLYYRASGNDMMRKALASRQAGSEMLYQPFAEERPIATAVGESLPYVAGGGAAGVGRGLLSGLARQAGAGGTIGALEHDPTMAGRGWRGAKEAALGAVGEGVGRGIGRMLAPGLTPRTNMEMDMIKDAQKLGFRAMPASIVNSPRFRQVVEGGLETMPTSAPVLDAARAGNESLLTRYAAEAIGEAPDTEALTGAVLDKAHRRIGREFNEIVGKDARYILDDIVLDQLERIEAERISPFLVGSEDPVRNLVDRSLELMTKRAGGEVTGRELYANISRLGNAAKSSMRNNPELGLALYDLQGVYLDAIRRQIPVDEANRLDLARTQWKNLVNIESSIDSVIGNINVGTLANRLQTRDKIGFLRQQNRSPFYTGVRFMARLQPELRTSFTAERSALQRLLEGNIQRSDIVAAGPAGLAALDPLAAGAGLALTLGAPYAAARAYTAPWALPWLTRTSSPATQGLLGMGGILGAHALARPD